VYISIQAYIVWIEFFIWCSAGLSGLNSFSNSNVFIHETPAMKIILAGSVLGSPALLVEQGREAVT